MMYNWALIAERSVMDQRTTMVALVMSVLVTGCASSDGRVFNEYKPEASFAQNIVRAGGFRSQRDAKSVVASRESAMSTGMLTAGDVSSIGNIVFNGLGGALFSLTRPRNDSGDDITIIAWPPISYAATADAAREKFFAETTEVLSKSVLQVDTETPEINRDEYRVRTLTRDYPGKNLNVRWRTGKCAEMSQGTCYFYFFTRGDHAPEMGYAPEILGRYDAWRFDGQKAVFTIFPLAKDDGFPPRIHAAKDFLKLFETASAELPEWVYIYIPANRIGFENVADGNIGFYPLPMVLNQGRAYYFIEGAQEAVPVIRDFPQI